MSGTRVYDARILTRIIQSFGRCTRSATDFSVVLVFGDRIVSFLTKKDRREYDEIVARDKANLDIFWLKDESLEDSEILPPPAELAAEIVESLEAALEEFRAVEEALMPASGGSAE